MSVDLTLPPISSPALDPYKHVEDPLLPFALYIHIDGVNEDDVSAIESECNCRLPDNPMVKRGPRHDLAGQPLVAAVTDHLINISARRFDPFYFVAVVDKDWKESGVILVTMDDDSDENVCRVDRLRVPAGDSGILLVNLQIANQDWCELKDEYEE
ncbi:hypothetical protein F5B22DRAFT_648241 [Xylaria bambusicola]|uniref:uncharacterized protein n=1 Tax=Xylaria bambusicola TaxID=326684 RepID=UPI0020072EDD|nr:uncharacterized protein F5B22DRAFT_648241 [Xylaria bambusicola]KAI0512892.1 hypothetical protein F5B22DRAFT_648241 [Xylaria bambusicola]